MVTILNRAQQKCAGNAVTLAHVDVKLTSKFGAESCSIQELCRLKITHFVACDVSTNFESA